MEMIKKFIFVSAMIGAIVPVTSMYAMDGNNGDNTENKYNTCVAPVNDKEEESKIDFATAVAFGNVHESLISGMLREASEDKNAVPLSEGVVEEEVKAQAAPAPKKRVLTAEEQAAVDNVLKEIVENCGPELTVEDEGRVIQALENGANPNFKGLSMTEHYEMVQR